MGDKKCDQCEKSLPKDGNIISCQGCQRKWHPNCGEIKKDTWKARSAQKKLEWRCKACREKAKDKEQKKQETDNDETTSSSEESEDSGKKPLKKKKSEKMKNLETKVKELVKSIEYLMSENEDLKKSNKELKAEIKEIKHDVDRIKREEVMLKKKVNDTQQIVSKNDQYDRMKNIEICGVNQKEDEKIEVVLKTIAEKLEIEEFTLADVDKAHRLRPKKEGRLNQEVENNARSPNIIVQFKDRKTRDTWINRKKKILLNKDIYEGTDDPSRIYVNEHLTVENKRLLMKAKNLTKEHKWRFTWVKEAKILCRKSEGQKVVLIENEEDLKKIK